MNKLQLQDPSCSCAMLQSARPDRPMANLCGACAPRPLLGRKLPFFIVLQLEKDCTYMHSKSWKDVERASVLALVPPVLSVLSCLMLGEADFRQDYADYARQSALGGLFGKRGLLSQMV